MKNPLIEIVEENEDKFYGIFDEESSGRLAFEERNGEKGNFLEIKVLNDEARLVGIVWFFGMRRAYIEDVRLMVARKESQKVKMVLLAGEGTTSAGKKLLKEADIVLLRDLEALKSAPSKKKRKKVQKAKEEQVTSDDDVSIVDIPDNNLIRIAKNMVQRREPEIINVREIKGLEEATYEIRGYTSNKEVLAVYRVLDTDSVGVRSIRTFITTIEGFEREGIPIAIIARDKFTPSARKEASDFNINLISEREQKDAEGSEELQQLTERLKEGAEDIITQRGYKIIKKSGPKFMMLVAGSESLGTYLIAENDTKEQLLVLLPSEEVIRVATVREFKKQMENLEISDGMMIALRRFTYTAERESKEFGITALKNNHPVFNIFRHELVPEHELMDRDEVEEMLQKYNAKLNHLPKIYDDDSAVVAINAKVGDVVKIKRNDDSYNFRLVIPRPDAGSTEAMVITDLQEKRRKRKAAMRKKGKVKAKAKPAAATATATD